MNQDNFSNHSTNDYSNLIKDGNHLIKHVQLLLNVQDHLLNSTVKPLHYRSNSSISRQVSANDKDNSTNSTVPLMNVVAQLLNNRQDPSNYLEEQ